MSPSTMKTTVILLLFLAGIVPAASGQVLTNLDFEQATVVVNNPTFGWLDWNLAVPGWGHLSSPDTSIVYYRFPHFGQTPYYLLVDAQSRPNSLLAGNYSLIMANGFVGTPSGSTFTHAYISQTGTIPGDARSIRLLATGTIQVLVGGTSIPLTLLGGNAYAGDIAAYAGTTAELRIVNSANLAGPGPVVEAIDNITFSPVPVPEPSTLALVGAGIVLSLTCRVRLSRRRRHAGFSPDQAVQQTTASLVASTLAVTPGPRC